MNSLMKSFGDWQDKVKWDKKVETCKLGLGAMVFTAISLLGGVICFGFVYVIIWSILNAVFEYEPHIIWVWIVGIWSLLYSAYYFGDFIQRKLWVGQIMSQSKEDREAIRAFDPILARCQDRLDLNQADMEQVSVEGIAAGESDLNLQSSYTGMIYIKIAEQKLIEESLCLTSLLSARIDYLIPRNTDKTVLKVLNNLKEFVAKLEPSFRSHL